MKCQCHEIIIKIGKKIKDFFHPTMKFPVSRFTTGEKTVITQ